MDLAAVDAREIERVVDQMELQLQREREHRRRIDESLSNREQQLAAMHREVARAEAIGSLDDLASSARTVHRATIDRLRLTEATLRSLVEEESTMLDQQRLRMSSFRSRTQGLRERSRESATRARELDSHVKHFAGLSADLRETISQRHHNNRERAAELARWNAAHRESVMHDMDVRRVAMEESMINETAALRDHLFAVLERKRTDLVEHDEELRKVDQLFDAAGEAIQSSRLDVDAIAGYEVKRATLRGESQALETQLGALQDDASRIRWRIEEKEAQIEHACQAHTGNDSERAVDERLAALVSSAESLQQRRLLIHRRTTNETDLRRERLGDGEDEAQLRHMLNLLVEERNRFQSERQVWADQAADLDAKHAAVSAELRATLSEGDVFDTRASAARQELVDERHRIEVAIQETTRRTAALLEDLGRQ